MSRKLDWQKARFVGKRCLDYRREFEFPDRAERWLRVAERRQAQQRPARQRRGFGVTQSSSV
jgi:hypothetical protein